MNLPVGQKGTFQKRVFEIVQTIRRESASEVAQDALLLFHPDAREGRLIQANQQLENAEAQYFILLDIDPISPPGFDTLKIGQRVPIGAESFEITEIQRFRLSAEDQNSSQVNTWVWLSSRHNSSEWALVEYSDENVRFFRGQLFNGADLARIFI